MVKQSGVEASVSHPFFKCVTHTTEGLEYKFDFTDKEHCQRCNPKMLGRDPADNRPDEWVKPELKSLDVKDIAA